MRLPRGQESETLCRKGGTSRSDNAPHASGARVGAKLALWCHPFCDAGICGARVIAKLALWCQPFCDAGICVARVIANLACGASLSATREFAGLAWLLNSLVVVAMITTREPLSL